MTTIRRLARPLLDLLFPIECVGCEAWGMASEETDAERWLCRPCRDQIGEDRPACLVCGAHSPAGRTCYGCLPKTPLAGTLAVGPYSDRILRNAITTFKFHGVRAIARPLADLLASRVAGVGIHQDGAILVPLPLHPSRERERGFNQARMLAEAVGERLGTPVTEFLLRTRHTEPQTSLLGSAGFRKKNVADAFALRQTSPALQARVILVDDVLTTGATLEAAARVLATAGVGEIWAAVVARG